MSERVDRDDPVIAAIKKLAPASLKVILRDGTERPVAMPKSGNRWSRVSAALDSLPWERIECLDKDGRLAGGAIEREDDTDLAVYDDDGGDGATLKEAMRVMLEVMKLTMKETRQIFEAQTKSQGELVGIMVESMKAVQDSYTLALRVQTAQLASGSAGGDGGENAEVMRMLQMALMMQHKPAPAPAPAPQVKGGAK